jgi:hypothetical protein
MAIVTLGEEVARGVKESRREEDMVPVPGVERNHNVDVGRRNRRPDRGSTTNVITSYGPCVVGANLRSRPAWAAAPSRLEVVFRLPGGTHKVSLPTDFSQPHAR